MLSIIEKVIFLQDVDIFDHISSEDLSHVAAITKVIKWHFVSPSCCTMGIRDFMILSIGCMAYTPTDDWCFLESL